MSYVTFKAGGISYNPGRKGGLSVQVILAPKELRVPDCQKSAVSIFCRSVFRENISGERLNIQLQTIAATIGFQAFEGIIAELSVLTTCQNLQQRQIAVAERGIYRRGSLDQLVEFALGSRDLSRLSVAERLLKLELEFPMVVNGWWVGRPEKHPRLEEAQTVEFDSLNLEKLSKNGGGFAYIYCHGSKSAAYAIRVTSDGEITLWRLYSDINLRTNLAESRLRERINDEMEKMKIVFEEFGTILKNFKVSRKNTLFPYFYSWKIEGKGIVAAYPPLNSAGCYESWGDSIDGIFIK